MKPEDPRCWVQVGDEDAGVEDCWKPQPLSPLPESELLTQDGRGHSLWHLHSPSHQSEVEAGGG